MSKFMDPFRVEQQQKGFQNHYGELLARFVIRNGGSGKMAM